MMKDENLKMVIKVSIVASLASAALPWINKGNYIFGIDKEKIFGFAVVSSLVGIVASIELARREAVKTKKNN